MPEWELRIERTAFGDTATMGELLYDGQHICWTLEDAVRPFKIADKTAIPAGRYELDVTMSNRFKRPMVLVKGVPNYEGIRMHGGNTSEDTSGCPLVARYRDLKKWRIWGTEEKTVTALVSAMLKSGKVFLLIVEKR